MDHLDIPGVSVLVLGAVIAVLIVLILLADVAAWLGWLQPPTEKPDDHARRRRW